MKPTIEGCLLISRLLTIVLAHINISTPGVQGVDIT